MKVCYHCGVPATYQHRHGSYPVVWSCDLHRCYECVSIA